MALQEEVRSEACGTVQWMAPEVLQNFKTPGSSPYNKRCDIFSYGVLLWEIYHCTCPYADTGLDQVTVRDARRRVWEALRRLGCPSAQQRAPSWRCPGGADGGGVAWDR